MNAGDLVGLAALYTLIICVPIYILLLINWYRNDRSSR